MASSRSDLITEDAQVAFWAKATSGGVTFQNNGCCWRARNAKEMANWCVCVRLDACPRLQSISTARPVAIVGRIDLAVGRCRAFLPQNGTCVQTAQIAGKNKHCGNLVVDVIEITALAVKPAQYTEVSGEL